MIIKSLIKSALYTLYTRRLLKQVQQGSLPEHVALILDGNRRFALQRGIGSLKVDFLRALRSYQHRESRFGK